MRRLRQACLAAMLMAAFSSDAAAQEDGVFVDPDSPAGKEYAIPFDEARREAGGGSGGAPGSAAPFGEGIKPEGDGRPPGRDSRERESEPRASGDREDAEGTAPGRNGPGMSASLDGGGPSAGLVTGGIALGVLLVGGLVGLLVRRTSA